MKKFYSIVLMATALLIGTNVWATTQKNIQDAFDAGTDTTITLTSNVDVSTSPLTLSSGKTVNLKLAGFKISNNGAPASLIRLNKGTLNITGPGSIVTTANKEAIAVYGSIEDEADWSILNIGDGVSVESTKGTSTKKLAANAISVLGTSAAFGVKINILSGAFVYGDKYGIKINGTIKANGTNIPTVYIAYGAEVKAAAETQQATAVYSSGYGKFVIEGYVHGSTGVYVKSGSVVVNDGAKIQSDNSTGAGINSTGAKSGIDAGGNAIAIEGNNNAYSSEGISVAINGGEIIAGKDGYAVQNSNADGTATPKAVTISGGEFEGGAAGCVTVESGVNVALEGGTFAGDIETLIAALGDDASKIISTVVAQEGSQATVVIGKSEEDVYVNPEELDGVNVVKYEASTEDLDIDLSEDETTLEYLSLTGKNGHYATLTVAANQTLKVGQIVMNANGRLIVEAGAKLIVSGANGIFADNVENLVLQTSQDAQAIFLLNPEIKNNRHPKATVQFISKAYRRADNSLAWQRFGIPSFGALTNMEAAVPTAVSAFDPDQNAWIDLGVLGSTLSLDAMAEPFAYYQMANNTSYSKDGTVVTMQGQLFGNDSPSLSIRGNFWNGFANSYMAPISGRELLDMIPSTVDKAFYLNVIDGDQAVWKSVTLLNMKSKTILPMQPFLIRNTMEAAEATIDYSTAVYYTPAGSGETKPSASPAPAREHALNDITMAELVVKGENGADELLVAEGADFSAEFDNGYDAAKYMNDGFNMYVSAVEKMSIFATDDLNNTYVGIQTVKGGNYTIEFANVEGAELTLIDHETGARVAMVEGATYEFTAGENTVNDYRFEIVGRANMPTAIDNTEAVKSAKGVYTITGQYVGEMNVWSTLPAGVYVVNGEKRVK